MGLAIAKTGMPETLIFSERILHLRRMAEKWHTQLEQLSVADQEQAAHLAEAIADLALFIRRFEETASVRANNKE